MSDAPDSAASVPSVIERFVRQLIIAYKAVTLYPASSAIPLETARDAVAILREALRETSDVEFTVTRDGLFYEQKPIYPGNHAFIAFAREFYQHMIAEVRFHAGMTPADLIAFFTVLSTPAEEVAVQGGFEARLWDGNVAAISITESKIVVVDTDIPVITDETALSVEEVDDLIARARRGGIGELTTVATFMCNPTAVRTYLSDSLLAGGVRDFDHMTDQFSKLAQIAASLSAHERDERMRSLAESIFQLAEDIRAELVGEHLLPEARSSDPIAAVVRQMDVDQIIQMFATSNDTETLRTAMIRAIRNLSALSGMDTDAVSRAASGALMAKGYSMEQAEAIVAEASPTQLTVRDPSEAIHAYPNDAVVELIDHAPLAAEVATDDPEIKALITEARRGLTDGDVVNALVTLVALDSGQDTFDTTMKRIEGAIGLLIERGEFEAAAEVTATLGTAACSPEMSDGQRRRIVRAMGRFAQPDDVRAIALALRLYPVGSPEHTAAMRLIKMLGPLTIRPLLEQLADEPDMATRKSLVDTISGIAPSHIAELGEGVTDPRWYFVRNVVSILGSTKQAAILPFLERTLRHADARVRRETIRALSLQGDRLAAQMLVHCLSDEDAQNVQLAARFIGQRGVTGAAPTLEQVARGEGRGNREAGPRIEAIEALGRLGAQSALPTLRALAGKRTILRGARVRELRTSALAAIQRIESQGGVR